MLKISRLIAFIQQLQVTNMADPSTGQKIPDKPTQKGGVHILGENCPRSDPDVAHMGQYLDPNM